jgi:hypothetical protein
MIRYDPVVKQKALDLMKAAKHVKKEKKSDRLKK